MPFRIPTDDQRAVTPLTQESVDGARDYCKQQVMQISSRCHGRVDNFAPLEQAYETYQQIEAGASAVTEGAVEMPDESYMSATFHGMREAVTRKCGELPTGCFRCENPAPRYIAGAFWIRHAGDKHYIVFTDAYGNTTEYRVYYCPLCGKKF